MGYIKTNIDGANKTVQFQVKQNAQSVSLKTNAEFLDSDLNGATVTVELVMTGKMNQRLYSDTFTNLKKILKGFYPNLNRTIPFAFDKSLVLNDQNYLLVTITWVSETAMTSFEYAINSSVESTTVPLVIKKKTIAVSEDVDTEFYPLFLFDDKVTLLETVIMVDNGSGQYEPRKIVYTSPLIKSLIGVNEFYAGMMLQNNQKVKVEGNNVDVYLIQVV